MWEGEEKRMGPSQTFPSSRTMTRARSGRRGDGFLWWSCCQTRFAQSRAHQWREIQRRNRLVLENNSIRPSRGHSPYSHLILLNLLPSPRPLGRSRHWPRFSILRLNGSILTTFCLPPCPNTHHLPHFIPSSSPFSISILLSNHTVLISNSCHFLCNSLFLLIIFPSPESINRERSQFEGKRISSSSKSREGKREIEQASGQSKRKSNKILRRQATKAKQSSTDAQVPNSFSQKERGAVWT